MYFEIWQNQVLFSIFFLLAIVAFKMKNLRVVLTFSTVYLKEWRNDINNFFLSCIEAIYEHLFDPLILKSARLSVFIHLKSRLRDQTDSDYLDITSEIKFAY